VKQVVQPASVPSPGGAYSQCIRTGNFVFLAGMIGVDADRRVVGDDVASQTRRALENMRACLQTAGATLTDVCSVTAFLEHADRDFATYNQVYQEFFPTQPPVRATVQAHIVGEPIVEIQAIAVVD